jgi:hypothetical protein
MNFTKRTGVELQAARKAAAERFQAIAMQHVPEGYTVEYRKSLSGAHYGTRKLIQAPRPVTRKSLYIFLHECAHAALDHSTNGKVPRHVEEMEAEKWAHEKMRENGVPVPRAMTQRAKKYVARKIHQARRAGAKTINSEAARFAQVAPAHDRRRERAIAWIHLYNAALSFNQWATRENIALAIRGLHERTDNQGSNLRAIKSCASTFQKIAEKASAALAEPAGAPKLEAETARGV